MFPAALPIVFEVVLVSSARLIEVHHREALGFGGTSPRCGERPAVPTIAPRLDQSTAGRGAAAKDKARVALFFPDPAGRDHKGAFATVLVDNLKEAWLAAHSSADHVGAGRKQGT